MNFARFFLTEGYSCLLRRLGTKGDIDNYSSFINAKPPTSRGLCVSGKGLETLPFSCKRGEKVVQQVQDLYLALRGTNARLKATYGLLIRSI
jgi:hypothetical protein